MAFQEIHYQTYVYENKSTNQFQTITIPVKKFASVKILVLGNNTDTSSNTVILNNTITLQPYICTLLQQATSPYLLELTNNAGEIDNTQMTIKVPLDVSVLMIFKFYNS
jgi:hypothetical protein